MYPLVYGDDVDGIVEDGIPEYDTSDTAYHIVSTAPVLKMVLTLTELGAQTRTKQTNR